MSDFNRTIERRDSDSSKWRRYAKRDILPLWVADMDFPAAPPILEAVARRANHGVFGYAEPTEALIETVAARFANHYRWEISPEWIVFSPGLGVAIHTVCRMAGEPGDEIITPSPIYHVFRRAPQLAKRIRIDAPMHWDGNQWQLTADAIEQAATPRSRLLQLCNPHNPNGKVFSRRELADIANICEKHNLLICADDVHADLILDDAAEYFPIPALDNAIANRTILMQSPSKAYNIAGLNFAVLIIPNPQLRARYLETAKGQVLSHLNSIGMAASAAAWGGECEQWRAELIAHLKHNHHSLLQAVKTIDGMTMTPLQATYLAWINIADLQLKNAPQFFESHGLGMSPGGDFGDDNYMRLNFGCTAATLNEAIRRLKSARELCDKRNDRRE